MPESQTRKGLQKFPTNCIVNMVKFKNAFLDYTPYAVLNKKKTKFWHPTLWFSNKPNNQSGRLICLLGIQLFDK